MSRRFRTSKFKNAAPKAMKHEPWVRDLTVGSYNCFGNFIKASAALAAFNVQPTGTLVDIVGILILFYL
jgi:coronin-7